MMSVKLLMGTLFICFYSIVNAQEVPVLNAPSDQIAPSPTAAALGTYGGMELRKSTGGISKNISLFQLQQGDIPYNPSIEYYSTGVRVDEWGGVLGIGWSDNFTATIQRTVGTIPDEYSNQRLTAPVYEYFGLPGTQEKYSEIVSAEFNENLKNGATNTFDPQYDIFAFNLFGKTGQFVIVNNAAVLLNHREKIKIEILGTSPTYSFCLTDLNGFKYFFEDDIEYTSLGVDEIVTPEIATAWFVDRIVSPLKHELTFNYDPVSYASKSNFYQSYTYKNRKEPGDTDLNDEELQDNFNTSQNSYGISRTHISTQNLTSVVGDNFGLSFSYVPRTDLVGGKLLKEIVLTDGRNARVSKVQFEYSTYTSSTQLQNQRIYHDDDYYPWFFGDVKVRYFLEEVKLGTDLSPDEKLYSFSYAAPGNLPPRFSLSQDEGGYFNGILNEWFIPKARIEEYIETNSMIWDFPMSFTGDRRTTEAAKTGILNKIVYPTGGVDSIEYELNSYTTTIENEQVTTYSGEVNNLYSDGYYTAPLEEFDWVTSDRAVIELDWDVFDPAIGIPDQDESGNHFAWFFIEESGGGYQTFHANGVAYDSIKLGIESMRPLTVTFTNDATEDIQLIFKLYGRYTRVKYHLDSYVISEYEGELPLPGVRVKQITTRSHTSPDMVKRYDYRNFSSQGNKLVFSDDISSNWVDLANPFVRRYLTRELMTFPSGAFGSFTRCVVLYYYNAYSSTRSETSLFGGNSIAYSCVTEIEGDAFTAGLFDVQVDQAGWAVFGDEFPLAPRENSAWSNGLESRRYYGTRNVLGYSVEKEQRWEYSVTNSIAVENCDFFRRYSNTGSYYCAGPLDYEPFTIISYNLWKSQYNLSSFAEILYSDDGLRKMSNTIGYSYDANGLMTREVQTNSEGLSVERMMRYPKDVDAGTYLSMAQENLLSYPVEEIIKLNGDVVGSKLTTYRLDNGMFVKDKAYSTDIDVPVSSFSEFDGTIKDSHYSLDPEVEYIAYSSSGRIMKTRSRQGLYTYFLWGYNNSYPVAKIESHVVSQISIPVDDNNFSNSDLPSEVDNDVNYLRALLSTYISMSDCRVNIYTYKPLIGMTSQTDANGLTQYFEYDDLGRLNVIRDDDHNIVKVYQYSYAGNEFGPAMNYVRAKSIQEEGLYDVEQAESWGVDKVLESTSYFDGLGRLFQDVMKQNSPTFKDVVIQRIYDRFGRDSLTFLPYTDGSNGAYKPNALRNPTAPDTQPLLQLYRTGMQYQFYQQGGDLPQDQYPYSQTVFEPNSLNRVAKRGAPGEAWQPGGSVDNLSDRTIKMQYDLNEADDVVLFKYDGATGEIDPTVNGEIRYYAANELYANRTYDEHNNEVIEYKDKQGRLVLKRAKVAIEESGPTIRYAETYYIYDELDNLVMVLPPEAVKRIIAAFPD